MMLLNKKSDTSYLAMCCFLLCACVAFEADRGKQVMAGAYALLSFVGLPIVSFWYWPLKRESAMQLHALCMAGDRNALIMITMQMLLALGYIGLATGILRMLRDLRSEPTMLKGEKQFVTGSTS
jgi:hypothetical protein